MTVPSYTITNDVRSFPDFDGHEQVMRLEDPQSGLRAFIGIHNTALGPALGGCRTFAYAGDDDAIRDVLRLSRGMTYKNALAGLPLGGGKSVIIADPYRTKTPAMMDAMGRAIEALNGQYVTAEDSGTSEADMEHIAAHTRHVAGLPGKAQDALGGNPSPVTARGVYQGLRAASNHRYGSADLKGLRVAVQGLGSVGYELCRLLHRDGAELIVTDIRPQVAEQAAFDYPGTKTVSPDEIFGAEAQIFSPCALGAQINEHTIPLLRADIVAGAANNQLATRADRDRLTARDILYVPDYVINAGGVIAVAYEYFGHLGRNPFPHDLTRAQMMLHVDGIEDTVARILADAEAEGISPSRAADERAEVIFKGKMAEKILA